MQRVGRASGLFRRIVISAAILAALGVIGGPRGLPLAFAQDPYGAHIVAADPLSAEEQLRRFQLPPGFEIQLVASEPEVQKPINLAFDAAGRLWATQSIEYPFPAPAGQASRDRVGAFSDFDERGRARRVETLISGLNIPIGVASVDDQAVVHSIPNLYLCRDSGGGRLDRREVLYREFGFADTHGMVNGLRPWIDGWIYACHGFSNTSQVQGADQQAIVMQSGNTFRFRADGSRVEHFTRGQVNPFGLAFDRWGNVYSTDCHTLPAYQLLRGAWYPSFGKPHDGLGFGPAMMKHSHGSTGLAGIALYTAEQFPPEYRNTLFIGNPITHRINHDRLEFQGSSPVAIEQPDFLICDDPWFRPVDVQLGPDGALYIADFYNRIIGHYEVPLTHPLRDRERGRIWRVIYRGTEEKPAAVAPPLRDLTTLNEAALLALLDDPNLALQTQALSLLVARGEAALPALRQLLNSRSAPRSRAMALWGVERIGGLSADEVRSLASDRQPLLRVHLLRALAERSQWQADSRDWYPLVREALQDEHPQVRRTAADALARHPAAENLLPLAELHKRCDPKDTHLIHVVRMALRDQLLHPGVYETAESLLAADAALAELLADVSLGAPVPDAGRFVLRRLSEAPARPRYDELLRHAARHLPEAELPQAYAWALTRQEAPMDEQRRLLLSLHRGLQERGSALPPDLRAWGVRLSGQLLAGDEAGARGGLELTSDLRLRENVKLLADLAGPRARHANLRPQAIDAWLAVDGGSLLPLAESIAGDSRESIELRRKAAQALGAVNSSASRAALGRCLPTAPQSVAQEIAFGMARHAEGAEALLALIEQGKASPLLLQDRNLDRLLRGASLPNVQERAARLTQNIPPLDARINRLIAERKRGFAAWQAAADRPPPTDALSAGQAVFRKTCAACHRLGQEGKKLAPDLDGIGVRGVDRLLEDILDPSRNVDAAFRAVVVQTSDGRTLQGLKVGEEGQVLVLADREGKEVRISHSEIDALENTRLSPMPGNVAELLPESSFYPLLEFLLSQRQTPRED